MANDTRSDNRIREDVRALLAREPYASHSDVELQVEEGVVVLSGTVQERRLRKEIEEKVREIPGVRDVENEVRASYGRLDESLNDLAATGAPPERDKAR
jgi:osmotically-inducible protein OsmY